jgi:hypothetical protein
MILSKKKLLSLIKENISEMAMDFDTQDRPDKGIQDKLKNQDTPLTKIPFPKTGQEPNQNFQELLASQRYKEVIQNLRRYTGVNNPPLNGMSGIMPLQMMMLDAHNKVVRIENDHRQELEKLAVELVVKDSGMLDRDEDGNIINGEIEFENGMYTVYQIDDDGDKNPIVQYDAKIVGMGEIDSTNFNRENRPQQNQPEVNIESNDVEEEEQLMMDIENLDLERAKRRLINSIIQGASKKGHYMYHLVAQELQQITGSNELLNLYGIMMSINDINYWQMSDQQIGNMGGSVAGKVQVMDPDEGDEEEGGDEENNNPFKIVARGINFPVLLHELLKGEMELIGKYGSPEDDEMFRQVQQSEDTLEKEMWDLRLGPSIWSIIYSQMPEEIVVVENQKKIQRFFLRNFFSIPNRKMLVMAKEILSKTENGRQLIQDMVDMIKSELNNQDYQEAMQRFNSQLDDISDETSGDDLNDFLNQFGISVPDDDDDDDR